MNVLESGPPFKTVMDPTPLYLKHYEKPSFPETSSIPPGKGLALATKGGADNCDGLVDSFCGRDARNDCMLNGHHDGRNGIRMDGYSGWLKVVFPKMKYGYAVVKMETWHKPNTNGRTANWTAINNERRLGVEIIDNDVSIPSLNTTYTRSRRLAAYCDQYEFQVAIDGDIKSYKLDEFKGRLDKIQRVVEVFPLMADPSYTNGEEKDVEIAFRMINCGRDVVFNVNHLYWA